MADIRTLKLALLADTKDFIAGLDKADKESKSFSDKLGSALKAGALAFAALGAAAGAAAIKIGIDAVKAAIEDEKAQASLAQTLRNTTKATDAQISATEEFIDKTARATGVADDQLRPSLQRLLVSTKDLTQAQKLQALALDISAGTGKDLLSVSDALAKASDGNFKALKNLGVELKTNVTTTKKLTVSKKDLAEAENKAEGASLRLQSAQERLAKATSKYGADSLQAQKAQNALEAAQISADKASAKYDKTLSNQGKTVKSTKEETISFDEAIKQLTTNFSGQADIAANTFAGRMARLKIALDEAKESIGQALLPILEKFARFATDTLAPALQGLIDGLTGKKKSVVPSLGMFAEQTNTAENAGYNLGTALRDLGSGLGQLAGQFDDSTTADSGFVRFINLLTDMVNGLDNLFSRIDSAIQKFRDFKQAFNESLIGQFATATGQFAPEAPLSGKVQGLAGIRTQPTTVNNINVKGAIDPQATARAIVKVTNTATRTTGIRVGPGRA